MRSAAATLLFVQGGLGVLMTLFCLFGAVVTPLAALADGDPDGPPMWFGALFYGGMALLQGVCCAFVFAGATSALNGRRWGLAVGGAVAGVIAGMSCCNVLGLGLSIAALAMLSQPAVRGEFLVAAGE